MNKGNINNKYICEEFCYRHESNVFPSQFFAGENLNYILSEIEKKPRQLQEKNGYKHR